MTNPKVPLAKKIAKELDATGCIVLCFNQYGAMAGASYGTNKHNCNEMGETMNLIFNEYCDKKLRMVTFKEGPRSPFPKS